MAEKINHYIGFQVEEKKVGSRTMVIVVDAETYEMPGSTPEKALSSWMDAFGNEFEWENIPNRTVYFAVCGFEGGLKSDYGMLVFQITNGGFRVEGVK